MAQTDPASVIRVGPTGLPKLTLGWQALGWCSKWLLQPDGDNAGKPWKFTDEQARFVLWWYAIDEQGRFIYTYGMLRRMKGWGKDPVGAALCCIEFVGPCRFSHFNRKGEPVAKTVYSAWIQTAAVAKEQTRNTMTLFPGMMSKPLIAQHGIDIGKEIIYAYKGRCRIEAVTSSPRALEGGRPTFVLKNETHHWIQSNEGHEMASVIARNAAKTGARVLAISNAHSPGEDSDAERDYDTYVKIESGESRATGVMYDSLEAPPQTDLADPESLRRALVGCRGDSYWVDPERLMQEIYNPKNKVSDSRRFYLNQINAHEDSWCAPVDWMAIAAPEKRVLKREQIALGFDGSKSDDHTALVGSRISDGHLFTLGLWRPVPRSGIEVPRLEVDGTVRKAFEDYDVVAFYADVREWESYLDLWEQDFGDDLCAKSHPNHPIQWDMRQRARDTTLAVEAFLDAILERIEISHSGKPSISQYVYNARRRPNNYGVTVGKESPMSAKKIDWMIAAMLSRKARQDYLALPPEKQRRKRGITVYVSGGPE